MATKRKGEKTLLMLGDGVTPTEAFTKVANVVSIDPNEVSVDDVERTNLESDVKEYRPSSTPEMGELKFTLQWDPGDTAHQALEDMVQTPSDTIPHWRVVYPGANPRDYQQFSGYLKSFAPATIENPSDLAADVTIKVTSKITRGSVAIT
jgi:hypothetical protein